MYRKASSAVDSEDSLLDVLTAPTTPDDSLTFSPVLQAQKFHDGLEDAASTDSALKGTSLDVTLYPVPGEVKNICCVGAGYVGM